VRLSGLKTGDKAIIIKVMGHGGFRKRIVEMGFVRGKTVEVLLNAPLRDPIKYKIMGYEVSLRRQEADLIEVVSVNETENIVPASISSTENVGTPVFLPHEAPHVETWHETALKRRREINVALVGNPNSGKTSLFNVASGARERVGNYSGVTVDAKVGHFNFQGYRFNLIDLPGTYSLSAYTPEELYVRKHIINTMPDVIINVVDASNLERNLYLTTQLIDMNVRVVIALNMYDELEASGNQLDYVMLSQLFGVPIIPTISKKEWGIDNLFHVIINLYEGSDYFDEQGNIDPDILRYLKDWHDTEVGDKIHQPQIEDYVHPKEEKPGGMEHVYRHIHVNHGTLLEKAIEDVRVLIARDESIRTRFSTRFLAIKLLENDKDIENTILTLPNGQAILNERDCVAAQIQENLRETSESAIIDAKYGFIDGALKEVYKDNQSRGKSHTKRIDAVVTHRVWGYPLFFAALWLMFQLTFSMGQYPMTWIESLVGCISTFASNLLPAGIVHDLVVNGIIKGVGAVIVFLPNILILYLCISFMEDTGYMARVAFIMDKLMHKIGLHGKSFIPLVMGFGCNVPAIMASRTIESRKARLVTMLINPLMSCSARLPVYIVMTSAFFPHYKGLVLFGMYLLGIALAAMVGKCLSTFVFKGQDIPFVMELPPYRVPTPKALARHTWAQGKQYLKKMGSIILIASIAVWALGYFPRQPENIPLNVQQENSYLGKIGKSIEPAIAPLGFDWKLGVGLISGIGAKEVVVSTLSIIYSGNDNEQAISNLPSRLPLTPLQAFGYMVFVLIYFPCFATLAAIREESGRWKYALFSILYSTALAWVTCFIIYQVGTLLL
jgi:ferrous iron transport protein B